MDPVLLADFLVVLHFAIVVLVVAGALAIPIGGLCAWKWVRHPGLRLLHLGTLGVVALQALCGRLCFLTIWEYELRRAAGQQPSEYSFVARLIGGLLYVEDVPQSTLDRIYYAFFALVLLGWILVPPRRPFDGRDR